MNHAFTEIPDVEEFTTYLFFNLTRKTYFIDIEIIYNKLHTVLSYLKYKLHNEHHAQSNKKQTIHELDTLLKIVLYTRDCSHGLNERKLAFAQLCCWYSVFPHQAIDIVKLFLLENDKQQPFGSWEDVKHLCDYIKNIQPNTSQSLIDILLTITHNETVKLFEQTIYDNHTNAEKLMSYHISNNIILKQTTIHSNKNTHEYNHLPHCIPTETSKYNWIFNILAEMWGDYSFNYTDDLDITYDTIIKRANKYRMVYRKTLQLLKKQKKIKNIQCTKITEQITTDINLTDKNKDKSYFIPIIDVSAFSVKFDTSDKNKHIDIIKYISNHASMDKILCVDNTVSIIDIKNIQFIETVPNNTYPDYNKAIDIVLEAIEESTLSNHEIASLKIVFISNIGTTESKPVIIYNYFITNFKKKLYGKPIPNIVFWNNSNENTPYFSNTATTQLDKHYFTTECQNIVFNNNVVFTSGLSEFSKHALQPHIKNTHQLITHILKENRYDIKYTPF